MGDDQQQEQPPVRRWWQRTKKKMDGCADGCGDGCLAGDGCADGCDAFDGCDLGGCDLTLMLLFTTLLAVRKTPTPPRTNRMAAPLVRVVTAYRAHVSPTRPPCCRFTPTCSAYALEALHAHGAVRGSWLTVRRLRRCRPGGGRGPDPVPAS